MMGFGERHAQRLGSAGDCGTLTGGKEAGTGGGTAAYLTIGSAPPQGTLAKVTAFL